MKNKLVITIILILLILVFWRMNDILVFVFPNAAGTDFSKSFLGYLICRVAAIFTACVLVMALVGEPIMFVVDKIKESWDKYFGNKF